LETSGESCECQCRNTAKEIAGTQCVCKTDITCAGTGEVIDPDTCACGCPPQPYAAAVTASTSACRDLSSRTARVCGRGHLRRHLRRLLRPMYLPGWGLG